MEYNHNITQVDSSVGFSLSTDDFDNSIGSFITVSDSYSNTLDAFYISISQSSINLHVVDDNNNPVVAVVTFSSDGYDDLIVSTDSDGYLSIDYAVRGCYTIRKDGYQDQKQFYDSDILDGGILQNTLHPCVSAVVSPHGILLNGSPNDVGSLYYS